MGKYFGTDGFRGEANMNLTADHAYKVGRFLGWYYSELKKRARLWYAADHLINADLLDKLSRSPYIEVRESVAENIHTSPETLKVLLQDMDFEVRETAVLNPNSPLSKINELLNDDHEVVRNAAKQRLQT